MLRGTHELRLGENEACLQTLHRALTLLEELGDHAGMSAALSAMVLAFHELGLHEEALNQATRSLELAKQSCDELTLAWAYNRAGMAFGAVGDRDKAIASVDFALRLAREVGDPEVLFAALNNLTEDLAVVARDQFDADENEQSRQTIARALELAAEALALAQASGNAHREALILLNLGTALGIAGEDERAFEVLDAAEHMAEHHRFRPIVLGARDAMARIAFDRGELTEAVARYRDLLRDAERAPDGLLQLNSHLALWRAYKRLGDYRSALEHHERYHELERQQHSQLAQTRARLLTNHLELDRARLDAERAFIEAAVQRSRTRELEAQTVALQQETALLARRAREDVLTGLWNRDHVEQELPRLLVEAGVRDEPVSVALIDADRFKSINDRFGHLVGDDVLRRVAAILRTKVRPSDVVARLGGEEFIVLLPGACEDDAAMLGQRLCEAVRDGDWTGLPKGCAATISVGIATLRVNAAVSTDTGLAIAELLGRADTALYAAKRAGRDRVRLAA